MSVAVQCAVERRTGKVQLTLVWNAESLRLAGAELARLIKYLRAEVSKAGGLCDRVRVSVQ